MGASDAPVSEVRELIVRGDDPEFYRERLWVCLRCERKYRDGRLVET